MIDSDLPVAGPRPIACQYPYLSNGSTTASRWALGTITYANVASGKDSDYAGMEIMSYDNTQVLLHGLILMHHRVVDHPIVDI